MSQRATVGRQDIPAQDKEMSVTTCYAKGRAEEGKEGEGAQTGKTVSTVAVCLCACLCVCVRVCVCLFEFIVCHCSTHDMRVGKPPLR